MKLINNDKEFKDFYPYKSPPNKEPCPPMDEYPKKYPCVCEIVYEDGGICGDYKWIRIMYPPRGSDIDSFTSGIKEGRRR
jgi:hypothetical protein